MRILHLTSDAFGGHGGIAKYNRDLLQALCSASEVDEVVCVPRIAPEPIGELPGKLRNVTDGVGGKLRYVRASLAELRHGPTDIVMCGHLNLLPIAQIARARHRAPLVLCIYGKEAWTPKTALSAVLCARMDAVISISATTLGRFREWCRVPADRCAVLPNAFEPESFGAGPPRDDLVERYRLRGRFVLLTLGRMDTQERWKGFDEILELLPRLADDIPNVAYLLVGDGSDRPRLEAKARSLGLADRVVFAGKVAESVKADHYRLADVFVMPSRAEGFGFVFLEAMACGIPVVASTADGSREAVLDGALGELVDPARPDDIRRGILAAAKRPRSVSAGLEFFSFPNFERRVHSWLTTFLDGRRHPKSARSPGAPDARHEPTAST